MPDSVTTRMQVALGRVSSSLGILRVRQTEADRAARNGDLHARLEEQVARLERIADELEQAVRG